MDYIRYLTERALEFRNLALTMRDPFGAQEFHHLADLCAEKAAALHRQRREARDPFDRGRRLAMQR